tara:strand:- start:1 stop:303 length:303 start_codon:yes stop_codon:yes gene_type:complete
MSEALYRDLKRLQEQKRRDWEAKAAPAEHLLGSFHAALRIFINAGSVDSNHLNIEFAEELLTLNQNLAAALERESSNTPIGTEEMNVALNRHITLLRAGG